MYGDSEQVLAIKDMNTFSGLLSVSDCLKTLTCEILQFVSLDFFQMQVKKIFNQGKEGFQSEER